MEFKPFKHKRCGILVKVEDKRVYDLIIQNQERYDKSQEEFYNKILKDNA